MTDYRSLNYTRWMCQYHVVFIARHFAGRPRNFVGQHFWARGYFVSTVSRDEQAIRAYIRDQEHEERRQEQLRLDQRSHP